MLFKNYRSTLATFAIFALLFTTISSCSEDEATNENETENPITEEEGNSGNDDGNNEETDDGTDDGNEAEGNENGDDGDNDDGNGGNEDGTDDGDGTEENEDENGDDDGEGTDENEGGEDNEDGTDTENTDTLSCGATYGANYIVIDAEATDSPLGEWKLIKKGEAGYLDKEGTGPINDTHLEFTGNNEGSGPAKSPLEYHFTAPETGTYELLIRMYQRLEGAESDKCNDVYVKLAGDFTSATNTYTTEILQNNLKFYGRGVNQWGSCYAGDLNHVRETIAYNLKAGEAYTFTMSGRSQRANIDYIILFNSDLNIRGGANVDIAERNGEIYLPNWDCTNSN